MAAHMIAMSNGEYNEDWSYAPVVEKPINPPKRVRYSYFTAGSGGAGPTILETSLLLAGEETTVYK
jgi:hypothetical protein